jgi:Zn-dependent peptidase ImmA (M78 family)
MDEELKTNNGPRLTEARHAALGLLKSAKITVAPVQINDIYQHVKKTLGVMIVGVEESAIGAKIDAVTKPGDGKDVFIIYNKARHANRIRFSVAHELGHLHLGHVHGSSSIEIGSDNYDEIEANTFAAYLLMNPAMMRKDIKSGIKDVETLAKRYQVSTDAMWWHLDKAGLFKLL